MVAMEAPMSASLGAIGPFLRKLDLLLSFEYRLPKALVVGIELLKEEVEEISDALVEQSTFNLPSHRAKCWMDEVRELSYHMEDCIDSMMPGRTDAGVDTKVRSVHGHRVSRVKIARLPKPMKRCPRISKIARLRTMVREASQRHERYQLDGCTSSSAHPFTRQPWAPLRRDGLAASQLVGTEDSKMKLIKWLTDETQPQLKVVPIFGSAGVGKTSLAKELYHEFGRQFECRAFVRASRTPDIRRLLWELLYQIRRRQQPSYACTVQNLIDNIREHLQDKRYFIVIDDLWETTPWDIMSSAFPEGNTCSRIITTTEILDTALECCGYQSENILKMRPLGDPDSGRILLNGVFGFGYECPDDLKDVSYDIIRQCGGTPLAMITIASLLSREPDNLQLWHHVRKHLCFISKLNPTLEEMQKEILNLSYNILPHYLRTCLLYLSMYPEGYTIWKVDLVKQWIAEGFIRTTEGKDAEEVAESYFYELVSMGMMQPMEINYNDDVLSCSVHHIVHEFVTLKSKEEKFTTAIDYSETSTVLSSKANRLSLQLSNAKYAKKPADIALSQVRSLFFFGLLSCVPSIVEFKLLRVLILEFWGDHNGHISFNLSRICRLLQLRYFKISNDIVVELPDQMGGLQYLETLEINARISALPLDIVHLPGLFHLSLRDKNILLDGIGYSESLRTLKYFDLSLNSEDNVRGLGGLANLLDLHLTYSTAPSDEHLKRNLIALAYSLGKLRNLKSLTLAPRDFVMSILFDASTIISFPPLFLHRLELLPPICLFSRAPQWIGQLHKLCILKIVVRELLMKDVDMLTGLPALTVLSLHVRKPGAEIIVFNRMTFPVLKCFKFWCGVLSLAFQEEAMPNLQRLQIGFNAHKGEQLSHTIAGIDHLLNLQAIDARIGAVTGAQESDKTAEASELKNTINKLSRALSVSIQMVHYVDEEIVSQEGCAHAARANPGLCIRSEDIEMSELSSLLSLDRSVIDGRIRKAARAEESESSAAESVLTDASSKPLRSPTSKIQMVDSLEKE